MELIKATNINFHTGTKDLFYNSNFRILENHKYGLIGVNGCGKTTLIRLILKELEVDKGSLWIKDNLKIGYLPQNSHFNNNETIEEFMLANLSKVMKDMKKFEEQMANPDIYSDTIKMEKILNSYQKVCDRFEKEGGYIAKDRSITLLRRLGLDNELSQKMGTLSGGEKSLVFFARALLNQPELLILDEPGNHLDFLGLAWLENFLIGYPGAVIIVSHNRYLLDKCCETLLDLDKGEIIEHKGSYSSLRVNKYRSALVENDAYNASKKRQEQLIKKIKELQSIAQQQYNAPATVMSQLGAAQRKLEQEREQFPKPIKMDETVLNFDFGDDLSKSKIALQVNELTFGFGKKTLFENASFNIFSGEKVALVGPNGSGKTTFLKLLLKDGDWDTSNTLRIGPSQKIGYLSQDPKFNKDSVTIADEIRSWGSLSYEGAYAIASHFSFLYIDLEKRLDVLSGGELNRLQLARLMYLRTNFLILDEPTNHMDIQSRELIESALEKFPGTILVVSHDRFFLDKFVHRVIEIEEKNFNCFEGNFTSYFKEKYPILPRLSGKIERRGKERKNQKNKDNSIELKNIENRIESLETEKLDLEKQLKKSLDLNNKANGQKIAVTLEKLDSKLTKLYDRWESLI